MKTDCTNGVEERRRPTGPILVDSQVGDLVDRQGRGEHLERILAVELGQGHGAVALSVALIAEEAVDPADHVALEALHGA